MQRISPGHDCAPLPRLLAKRDRLILAMHAEGKTQREIGQAIQVDHATVGRVLARMVQNGHTPIVHQPARGAPPRAEWPEPEEAPKPTTPAAKAAPPTHATADVSGLMPLFVPLPCADPLIP